MSPKDNKPRENILPQLILHFKIGTVWLFIALSFLVGYYIVQFIEGRSFELADLDSMFSIAFVLFTGYGYLYIARTYSQQADIHQRQNAQKSIESKIKLFEVGLNGYSNIIQNMEVEFEKKDLRGKRHNSPLVADEIVYTKKRVEAFQEIFELLKSRFKELHKSNVRLKKILANKGYPLSDRPEKVIRFYEKTYQLRSEKDAIYALHLSISSLLNLVNDIDIIEQQNRIEDNTADFLIQQILSRVSRAELLVLLTFMPKYDTGFHRLKENSEKFALFRTLNLEDAKELHNGIKTLHYQIRNHVSPAAYLHPM